MTASGRRSRRRSRSRARRAASSSWPARPGSARRRSSPSLRGRAPRAVGRLRPAHHAAADGAAARRRAQAGGALAEAVEGSREDLLSAVLDELRAPAALVVEDLHWADDATLDFVALLGRRLPRSRGCLIVTCRPDLRARGAARARPRCRASACARSSPARCRRRRWRCWRGGRAATPPTCTPPPAATRSSSPRCSPRPRASESRPACATRWRCARPPPGREARAVAELAAVFPGRPSWRS